MAGRRSCRYNGGMTRAWLALLVAGSLGSACSSTVDPITECPGTSRLVDGACRVRCDNGTACLVGETCDVALGVCRSGGTDGGVGGQLRFEPRELVFEATAVGRGLSRATTLFNDGADVADLELVLEGDDFTWAGPAQPFELPRGTSAAVVVNFLPGRSGAHSGTLIARGCGGACTTAVILRGEAVPAAALRCEPDSVDLGDVGPAPITRTVRCTKEGTDTLIVTAVTGFDAVTVTAPTPATLASGAGLDLVLEPTRAAVGPFSGTVEVALGSGPGVSVPVRGRVLGTALRCAPSSLDLGLAAPGEQVDREVQCTNDGRAAVTLTSAFLSPPVPGMTFETSGDQAGVIAPGAALGVKLSWTPTDGRRVETVLRLATSGGPVEVPIRGNAPRCTLIALDGATFDFGLTAPGTIHDASVALRNTGGADCRPVLQLAGPGAAEVGIVGAPTVIAPGALAFVELRYTPQAAQLDARLTLTTTASADVVRLDLTGIATAPPLAGPTAVRWDAVQAGCRTGNTRVLDLINEGRQAVNPTSVELVQYEPVFFQSQRARAVEPADRLRTALEARPPTPGPARGRLRVALAGGRSQFVELFAAGEAVVGRTTEVHEVAPVGPVDVLFVVDGDLRTGRVAQRLAAEARRLFQRLTADRIDYHVGVLQAQPLLGAPADLVGTPAVITSATPDPAAVLAAHLTSTNVSLTSAALLAIAHDATTEPARVSAPNRGFLRRGGQLELVIVTARDDVDDDSTVSALIEALGDRVLGRPRAVRISAISGGPQGCRGNPAEAEATDRLSRAVARTGGVELSACDPAAGDVLEALGRLVATPLPAVFALTSQAIPGTVTIGSVTAQSGWVLEPAFSRVVFDAEPSVQPRGLVTVSWQPWCIASTCGDGRVSPTELCDEADRSDTDECPTTCHRAACGDGFVQDQVEACDDGNLDDEDGCTRWCTFPR